ncbi:MAG: RNA-binding protein [Candidatus Diapherotrites archaeon]|nr:RNA-binding protein [Candidatus Diapherotrites archaeon]
MMKVCMTSNREVTIDFIEFKCPACSKERIVRSLHSRQTAKPYVCPSCGFVGP